MTMICLLILSLIFFNNVLSVPGQFNVTSKCGIYFNEERNQHVGKWKYLQFLAKKGQSPFNSFADEFNPSQSSISQVFKHANISIDVIHQIDPLFYYIQTNGSKFDANIIILLELEFARSQSVEHLHELQKFYLAPPTGSVVLKWPEFTFPTSDIRDKLSSAGNDLISDAATNGHNVVVEWLDHLYKVTAHNYAFPKWVLLKYFAARRNNPSKWSLLRTLSFHNVAPFNQFQMCQWRISKDDISNDFFHQRVDSKNIELELLDPMLVLMELQNQKYDDQLVFLLEMEVAVSQLEEHKDEFDKMYLNPKTMPGGLPCLGFSWPDYAYHAQNSKLLAKTFMQYHLPNNIISQAPRKEYWKSVSWLLENYADTADWRVVTDTGCNCLWYLHEHKKRDLFKRVVLETNVNIGFINPKHFTGTIVHQVVKKGDFELTKFLLGYMNATNYEYTEGILASNDFGEVHSHSVLDLALARYADKAFNPQDPAVQPGSQTYEIAHLIVTHPVLHCYLDQWQDKVIQSSNHIGGMEVSGIGLGLTAQGTTFSQAMDNMELAYKAKHGGAPVFYDANNGAM